MLTWREKNDIIESDRSITDNTSKLERIYVMSFGETIKKLRRDLNMTQEKLAEMLSISPQAVSRWETNVAMPDISLLPPLANLFNVTTDFLLGMDTYQKDLRKAEFDKAFFEYWNHDDKESNYQIAVQAVAEYPGNMEYVEWLASAEYYIAIPNTDDSEYKRLLESSVMHYNIVLDNAKEPKLLNKALHGMVLSLCMLQRKEEAKEYAMRLENEIERADAICWCLDGEEKIRHCQSVAESYLNRFLFRLTFATKTLEAYEAVEKILAILFPDGNYQYYHNTLQYNSLGKALVLCRESRFEEAIAELEKTKHHAEEMVKYSKENGYRFTAPLFHYVAGKKPVTDSDITDLDDFYRALDNNTCFDPIRDRKEFKALYEPNNIDI